MRAKTAAAEPQPVKLTRDQEVELLVKARQDLKFFEPIYQYYYPLIMGFIYRRVLNQTLAEDITSQSFFQAITALNKFSPQGYGAGAWLYRIAHNCLMDHYRHQKRLVQVDLSEADQLAVDQQTPETILVHKQAEEAELARHKALLAKLAQLKQEDQFLLSLKYFENCQNTKIAEMIGCQANAVGVRLHRALSRLRELCQTSEAVREEAKNVE